MRFVLFVVLWTSCIIAIHNGAMAQNVKLITFRSDSNVVLRWIGNTDASITGWHVERSVDAGPYTRLTPQPLAREMSNAQAVERLGRYDAGFYRMLFGVEEERNLTQQDIARTLSSDKVGFHFVLLASHPEMSDLTGERYIDAAVPDAADNVRYRIVSVTGGAEATKAESEVIDIATVDRVPVPDSVIADGPDNSIRLRWPRIAEQSNRGDVVAFRVWKGASEMGPFDEVTSTTTLTMFTNEADEKWYTWTDEYVDNGTTAYYYVRQVHGTGVLGNRSDIVVATAGETASPPIPNRFRLSLLGQAIQLDWQWPYVHPAFEVDLVRIETSRPDTRIVKTLHRTDTAYLDALVETGKAYTYVLVVRTATDSVKSDSLTYFLADVVAPLPPTMLKAIPDTGRIRLSWKASADPDVVGYRVHRSSAVLKNQLLLTVSLIVDTVFIDTLSRESEATHGYTVTAEDRSGNSSKPSAMLTARTLDVTPPVAPQIRRFERQGNDVSMAWTASVSKDIAMYHVERLDSGGTARSDSANVWRIIHSTSNTNTAVSIGGIGKHRFRVRAEDSSKNRSGPSVERVISIEADLTAPSNTKVTKEEFALKVEWNAVPTADGYRVERVDRRTNKRTPCATLAKDATSWHDRISSRKEAWRYEVAARDASWRYGPSSSATFTPPKE